MPSRTPKPTAVAFALLTLTALTGCISDIRPEGLKALARPNAQAEQRGRAMMKRAAELHGLGTWRSIQTYTVTMRDQWKGFLPRLLKPWPEADAHMRMSFRAGSFDARTEFLSGTKKGTIWGMQSWQTYEIAPGKPAVFRHDDTRAIALAAVQYLFEFHFRDHTRQLVSYAGPETVRGTTYERVFLTWRSMEPSAAFDQYMVYLDSKTGHVRMISFTAREMLNSITGTIHFEDLRDVGGILFPFTQYVTLNAHDDPRTDHTHVRRIEDIVWNTPALETFRVNKSLPLLHDVKP